MQNETNMNTLVIVTSREAPVGPRQHSGTSKWIDIFEAMRVGNWILLKDEGTQINFKRAAVKYLRGRYRCYQNPEQEGTWIFTKTK